MKPSDYFVILLYGTALFATLKMAWIWYQGGFNHLAVWEWFTRGYFFAWGVLTATLMLFLLIRIVLGLFK